MSNSRNNWNDAELIAEINSLRKTNSKLSDELSLIKKTLTTTISLQRGSEKKLERETIKHNAERKTFAEEKNNLLRQVGALTALSEQLELDLINANKEKKTLILSLQQSDEEIKNLNLALQQSKESTLTTVENKSLGTQTEIENTQTLVATEPTPEMIAAQTKKEEAVGPSTYSMFSPWRILGYNKNPEAAPTPENPAHSLLADLTKASVEQVKAENNSSPSMRKN